MNARQIEVQSYFKQQHPEALILYHLPGQYVLLGEDVDRASKSFPAIQVPEPGVGILPDDITILSTLGEDGAEIQLISYRNDAGTLDFPDVKRLIEEKEMDY